MGKYPKHRKPSGFTRCPVCNKTFCARGIGTHLRQKHGIVKTVNNITSISERIANNNATTFEPGAEIKELRTEVETKSSDKTGKYLYGHKKPNEFLRCTEQDVWILFSKICQAAMNEDTGNLLSVFATNDRVDGLIKDFEHRFDCKFSEVKRAYPNVHPGSSNIENLSLIKRYVSLKYSR